MAVATQYGEDIERLKKQARRGVLQRTDGRPLTEAQIATHEFNHLLTDDERARAEKAAGAESELARTKAELAAKQREIMKMRAQYKASPSAWAALLLSPLGLAAMQRLPGGRRR